MAFEISAAWADEVHVDAAPEAAAQERRLDRDLLGLEARDLGRDALRELLELRRTVDEARVLLDVRREVHRLHGGVGQERQLVVGLHALGRALSPRVHVAELLDDGARLGRRGLEAGGDAFGAERTPRALRPT
jgi:hypothetical protein